MIKGWLIAGGIGVLLAAGIAVQTARLSAAHTERDRERDRANANAAVVKQLQADADRAAQITADYAAQLEKLRGQERELRDRIAAAAASSACSDSDAIRRLLDGLRNERGTPDPGR